MEVCLGENDLNGYIFDRLAQTVSAALKDMKRTASMLTPSNHLGTKHEAEEIEEMKPMVMPKNWTCQGHPRNYTLSEKSSIPT